jgi:hypothetical protein
MYDYRGCPFPEGIMISEGNALFNHDEISEVIHTGYENDEAIDFIDRLEIAIEKNK